MAFLDAGGVEHLWTKVKELLNGKVSTGRKINGKALTADITLSAADVSAIPAAQKGAAGGTGRPAAVLRGRCGRRVFKQR